MYNILVLGHKSNQRSHSEENIAMEFVRLGHEVSFVSIEDIQKKLTEMRYKLHRMQKLPFRLSRFNPEDDKIDFIYIDQNDFEWLNDVKPPVFYNHKYVHRRFSVFYPTVGLYLTTPLKEYCEYPSAPYENYQTKYKFIFPSATETETYKPKPKEYKGISWFGSRNASEETVDDQDLMGIPQRQISIWERKWVRQLALECNVPFNIFETPIPTPKYREILPKLECHFFTIPYGQYISRMVFETMACKTLLMTILYSDKCERILEEMGFKNGIHYIGVRSFSDIPEAYMNANREEIVENAYNVVMERHLWKHRAEFIIQKYEELFVHENSKNHP